MGGIFISFEGIDGAGKTTHIDALVRAFQAQGRVVTRTREPGGTPLAEKLRDIVLNDPMDPMGEALLVFAARRDHIQQVIVPALRRSEVVICDRFTDATFAYQGAGRGFDLTVLRTLEAWVQGGHSELAQGTNGGVLQPDLTIWFDLPAQVAATRLASARVPDKFESQPQAFFESVSRGYLERYCDAPHRIARINADQPPDGVWVDVLNAVQAKGLLGPAMPGKVD